MNTRHRLLPRRNPAILASTVAALIASCLPADAANKTWDGAGADDNWLTGANWDLDTAPASNDALFFAGTTRLTPVNDFAAGSLFNGITFNAGAGAFTLSGNAIALSPGIAAGGGTVTGGNVTNNSTNAQTVNVPLTLAAGNHTIVTAASSGTLSLAGAITRQAHATAVFTRNGGQINLTGSGITNTNGILGGWAVIGNDWAALDGSGNVTAYTGYTPIATGAITSDPTLNYRYIGDSGNLTAATGTTINSLVTTITTARSLTITGTMKLGPNGGIYRTGASTANSVMTVTGGTLTANGGGEITLACATNSAANFAATNNNLTIASVIANDGGNAVSVNVLGYVVMSAANTFTGGTFINQGRVQASNSAAFGNGGVVTVFPGAEAFLNNNGTYANPFLINGIGATENSGGQQLGAIRMNTGGTNISGQITLATNSRISGGSGGNNVISGRITGPGRLEFTAATGNNGSITLSNPTNDWNGGLLVTVGAASRQVYLRLGASEVIPDGAGKGDMTIAGTSDIARLDLNGFSETINGLNSTGANNQITNLGAGTPVLTVGNNNAGGSFGGVISGSMGLTKIGSGTQTLSAANTYTGDTNVNAGALIVTDSLFSGGAVNVNTSASGAGTLIGTASIGNVTLAAATGANVARIAPGATSGVGVIGTLTLAGLTVNGGDLAMDLAATNDLVAVTGSASFLAPSTISPGGNPTNGTYTVLTAGTLTLTVPPTVNAPSGTRKSFTPDFSVANTIRITVADASKTLNWTGLIDGAWDVATTSNWHDGAIVEKYFNGDTVVLADGPANRTLTLTGITVTPGAVNVNNSAGDYTITGTGSIGGTATLTKTGPGPLTIANANTYTGGTTLAAGTLHVNHSAALGTGPITITGGMINNTSGVPIAMTANNAQQWDGDVTFVGSNNLNMGTGAVTLSADRTVTVVAGNLTVGGVVSGAFNLTKAGTGTLTLGGASTYDGVTNVNEGTVVVTNAALGVSSLGSLGGGSVNVVPGAAVDFVGSATANALNFGAKIFNIAGTGVGGTGALTHSGTTGQNNALQQVTLTADATVGGTGRFDIRGGGATLDLATHTLTKTGSNQFTLVGTNVTDGNIVVNQGVFAMETFTSFADFSTGTSITYNAGTTAQFFNLSGVITRPMIFNGSVTVGNASAQASSISSPMTLNGDLTFTNLNASTGALNVLGDMTETGGSRSITKNGPTTLLLGGTATLSGTTTVNAGTLLLTGTLAGAGAVQVNGGTLSVAGVLNTTGAVNVNTGGTMSVTGTHLAAGTLNVNSGGTLTGDIGGVGNVTMVAGSSLRPGATGADDNIGLVTLNSLTVNGGDMRFNLVEPGTNDAVTVTTGVTYTAASTLTPTGLTNGTYTLLTAGSAINYGAGGVNKPTLNLPAVDPLVRPKTYTLDTTTNTTQLKLTLAGGVKTITWTGITDGDWKINDNTRNNWKDAVNAPDVFYNNDTVQFGDGPANRNVVIPAALAPAAIVVNNSAGNDYVFSGAAIGGAATLTKSGAGALTLAAANTYTGGTSLTGGTLNINHATALGTGPITITGGTIDNTSGAPVVMTSTNAQQWNGDFTFTGSNNLSFGAGAVTLDADRIVTVTAGELTVPGVISGFSMLTKAGAGKLRLTGVNTYGAPTTISAGTVVVSNAAGGNSSLGSLGGGAVTIAAGGTVDLSGSATANALNFGAKQFYIAGTGADGTGAIISNGLAQQNALQQVFLTADATVGGSLRFDIRSAPTTALNSTLDLATFTLTKSGTNQFSLVGTNVTDGDIIVNGGTFSVETVTAIPDFASGKKITLNAGTTLQFFSNTAAVSAVTRPILINGAVTMGSASNGNNSTIGSPITLSGNLTVAALNNTNATSSVTLTGNIDETAPHSLTKNGPSTLVLAGTNSYSGGTFINAGVVRVTADAGLGAAAGSVTIDNGATLQAAGSFTSNRPVTLGIGGGTIDTNGNDVTLGAGSSVTGAALTKAGLGKLTIAGAQTYATLTTAAGITQIDSALGTGASTLNANAATVITASQDLAALNIGAGAVVILTDGVPSPAELALLIGGGESQPGDAAASPVSFEAGDSPFISDTSIGGEASGLATAVPEPGSLVALLSGAGTFLGLSRFRRRPAPRIC